MIDKFRAGTAGLPALNPTSQAQLQRTFPSLKMQQSRVRPSVLSLDTFSDDMAKAMQASPRPKYDSVFINRGDIKNPPPPPPSPIGWMPKGNHNPQAGRNS